MKPGARAYSATEKAEILEQFIHATESGKTQRDAAEALGVHHTTVMYWRSQVARGIELTDSMNPAKKAMSSHPGEHPLSFKKEVVRAFHAREGTQSELAERFGVNISTVAKWVRCDREGTLTSRVKEPKKGAQLKLVEQPPAPPPEPERKPRGRSPKKGRLGKTTLAEEPAQAPLAAASMSPEQVEIAMLRAENARLKRALVAATS